MAGLERVLLAGVAFLLLLLLAVLLLLPAEVALLVEVVLLVERVLARTSSTLLLKTPR